MLTTKKGVFHSKEELNHYDKVKNKQRREALLNSCDFVRDDGKSHKLEVFFNETTTKQA